jgi:hypothetical protein
MTILLFSEIIVICVELLNTSKEDTMILNAGNKPGSGIKTTVRARIDCNQVKKWGADTTDN